MVLLIGNWKMAPNKDTEALNLAKKTQQIAKTYKKNINFVSCVPSIHLPLVSKNIKSILNIGAQGISSSDEIAQTGLINVSMIKSYGATYCIVGHSESRARGETDQEVLLSAISLIKKSIIPVVCVGEKNRDAQGWYLSDVKSQVETLVFGIPKPKLKKMVLAYEPLWAIGSGAAREATVSECREMIIFIRKIIADASDEKTAKSITIIYGGSVNEQNASTFILEGGAQGLLVGRASLDVRRFGLLAKSINSVL